MNEFLDKLISSETELWRSLILKKWSFVCQDLWLISSDFLLRDGIRIWLLDSSDQFLAFEEPIEKYKENIRKP